VFAHLLGLILLGEGCLLVGPRFDRMRQAVEDGGNVIVELRARER
jgi:hypothetical protein